jgi:hypothetical protein
MNMPKAESPKHPGGRPTKYTPELADTICSKLSRGISLRQICIEENHLSQQSVYSWLQKYPEFMEKYTRAREEQADTYADEIIAIADETPEIVPVMKDGEVIDMKMDHAYIAWQKQRIEARKWTAMKLKPKKYGDRVALTGAEDGAPIKIESRQLFDAVLTNLETRRQLGEE